MTNESIPTSIASNSHPSPAIPRSFRFEISFTFPTRSPPNTGVFTHNFTHVYCISKTNLFCHFSDSKTPLKNSTENKEVKREYRCL
ncbi:hypothetical protein CG478_021675 [Bacillus cytotoxicus]|nr:hypothetical protein CG483_021655 [Bacillus cytotoxicus]AWC42826.1 hypothetical protein CG480_021675 [Bacillus cytotoxicus]AWC50757.1 hypothetical protein CG478_021675 [Bacillus cytotoxicus]AWC54812.1 hypothetical protein CG477_021860 [Bacillus cytotoxicus]AWC58934.1 hypothetical protein CG476_021880 [Bacillus cytotoxicus]